MLSCSTLGRVGRLGNQMFQYASLVGIADKLNCPHAIPYAGSFVPRELIKGFEISSPELSSQDKIARRYREKNFVFNPKVFTLPPDTDIDGFFQSEKYFQHCGEKIRSEFQFKPAIQEEARRQIELLRDGRSLVSLHVRRGDYTSLSLYHPTCSLDYYQKAIQRFPDSKFVVFSDDIDWCKQNFIGDNFEYVAGNNQYVDMCMMGLCDHHIIANSSFSWWGAWLNPNPNKIVIAPKRWFGIALGYNTRDLYPENWIVIGSRSDYLEYYICQILRFAGIVPVFNFVDTQIRYFSKYPDRLLPLLKKKVENLPLPFSKK